VLGAQFVFRFSSAFEVLRSRFGVRGSGFTEPEHELRSEKIEV
jgi:hypothetical protein